MSSTKQYTVISRFDFEGADTGLSLVVKEGVMYALLNIERCEEMHALLPFEVPPGFFTTRRIGYFNVRSQCTALRLSWGTCQTTGAYRLLVRWGLGKSDGGGLYLEADRAGIASLAACFDYRSLDDSQLLLADQTGRVLYTRKNDSEFSALLRLHSAVNESGECMVRIDNPYSRLNTESMTYEIEMEQLGCFILTSAELAYVAEWLGVDETAEGYDERGADRLYWGL